VSVYVGMSKMNVAENLNNSTKHTAFVIDLLIQCRVLSGDGAVTTAATHGL
jgi:hypothetical protein